MSVLIKGITLDDFVRYGGEYAAHLVGIGDADELPPDHGDLVDYRWLLSEYQNVCYGMSCDECKLAAKDIRNGQLVITGCALEDFFAVAPVVIPAERSEDGET